jgi:carbon monoxide dehydrogenase subunit G
VANHYEPLRFEGTVDVVAQRALVWSQLTTPEVLADVTPGVVAYEIVEPERHFRVSSVVDVGGNQMSLPVDIVWVRAIEDVLLQWEAVVSIRNRAIAIKGVLDLTGDDLTVITFSAETAPLPNTINIPPMIMRSLITRYITTFFTNFKRVVEKTSAADTV